MGSDPIDSVKVSKSKSQSSAGKLFPPGFRFHPTDEELVLYYLKRKICGRSLKLDIIAEVDVYKWDPEELPGQSKLKTGDRQWFFFSPRDRKYPNGGRSSRATMNGYWKATGKDRVIKRKSSPAGIKKTLVYYQGRAPSGQRTDWVMHEYVMDEQELKRCPLAQEHYVLYKIFKKSGPGPKNGEQYGAPFVEEEWSDDDCLDVESLLIEKLNPIPVNDFKNTNNAREEEETVLSTDMLEFLNKIMDEPDILPPLPKILENPKNLLEASTNEPVSVADEDFLELDDLIGPQPVNRGSDLDFDSLSGFDFYHESGSFGTQHIAYMGNFEYGPENSGLGSEVVNHDHEVHDELPVSYDLWNHNQADSSITSSQIIHEPVSNPTSGVVNEENPAKFENYVSQCPETNMEDNNNNNTDSWFSSALWSFIDSIPTTPASASESSALVNKAFERMSSFGRVRNINSAGAAATSASGNTTTKRLEKPKPSGSSSRSIVYFSVLGVLFAVLWVFVGSSIEVLGRLVWS